MTDSDPEGSYLRRPVLMGKGASDTRKSCSDDYAIITLEAIIGMVKEPSAAPKEKAQFIVQSSYVKGGGDNDARSHAAQRRYGSFPMLCIDVDKGNHDKEVLYDLIVEFFGKVFAIFYSTASATEDDKRWRGMITLREPLAFPEWNELMEALADFMAERGVAVDRSLLRPAQPVFLPNVPPEKRGEDGKPCFYDFGFAEGPPSSPSAPVAARAVAALRERRMAEERLRDQARAEAASRRAARRASGQESVIDSYNAQYSIADRLIEYGYEESPTSDRDWRSPNQTSSSYATRIFENPDGSEHWVSLSGSDAEAGLGAKAKDGVHYGDAFDLYVHYGHDGDFMAALSAAAASIEADRVEELTAEMAGAINATPYRWRDPAGIPPRPWMFGRWLLRDTVACVVAPGGVGKSTFLAGMALSMATGRPFLGKTVWGGRQRVWLWNLEDDLDELSRSIQAAAKHHGVMPADLEGYLCVDSAMEGSSLCTAVEIRGECKVLEPVYEALTAELIRRGIKVLVVDPFVSSHAVEENSNSKIDKIVKAWSRVAKAAGCVIVLVHHTSKAGSAEVNANSARGASALVSAARSVLVINRMTTVEAGQFGIPEDERRRYLAVNDDKHNRAAAEEADWFQLVSVELGNGSLERAGDSVAAVAPWTPPEVLADITMANVAEMQRLVSEGQYRASCQARDWVGHAVAQVLGLDGYDQRDRARIKAIVKAWIKDRYLCVIDRPDDKSKLRPFVEVGGVTVQAKEVDAPLA